jgi:hypothetical protein
VLQAPPAHVVGLRRRDFALFTDEQSEENPCTETASGPQPLSCVSLAATSLRNQTMAQQIPLALVVGASTASLPMSKMAPGGFHIQYVARRHWCHRDALGFNTPAANCSVAQSW